MWLWQCDMTNFSTEKIRVRFPHCFETCTVTVQCTAQGHISGNKFLVKNQEKWPLIKTWQKIKNFYKFLREKFVPYFFYTVINKFLGQKLINFMNIPARIIDARTRIIDAPIIDASWWIILTCCTRKNVRVVSTASIRILALY